MMNTVKILIFLLTVCSLNQSCSKSQSTQTGVAQDSLAVPSTVPINYQSKYSHGAVEVGAVLYNSYPTLIDNGLIPTNSVGLSTLPSEFSLQCPSIADQGAEGSCVGFAIGYSALSIMYKYKTNAPFDRTTNIMSPEWLYNMIKTNPAAHPGDCTWGSILPDAFSVLQKVGCIPWNRMPYTDQGCLLEGGIKSADIGVAVKYRIKGWSTVSINALAIQKQIALEHRPVIIRILPDAAFELLGDGMVYKTFRGPAISGHAVTIVGYNDAMHAFKIMNQWGVGWGSSGFGWIDYDVIKNKNFLTDAYVITGVL